MEEFSSEGDVKVVDVDEGDISSWSINGGLLHLIVVTIIYCSYSILLKLLDMLIIFELKA